MQVRNEIGHGEGAVGHGDLASKLISIVRRGCDAMTEPIGNDPGYRASSALLIDGDEADLENMPVDLLQASQESQRIFFSNFRAAVREAIANDPEFEKKSLEKFISKSSKVDSPSRT